MIVNSTELQNNFGKYLMLAAQEDIVITRNGTPIATLSAVKEPMPDNSKMADRVMERAETYDAGSGRKASFAEFLALTKNTEDRYEYIDGEIYLLASPKTAHQYALTELLVIFYSWFQGKTCRPMVAPYDIELRRTPDNINIVQPDLMVICDLEEHLDEDDYYKGVPALVVEILSAITRSKDLIKKLDLYMSCGVKEYWIVNPLNKEIAVYRFEENNIHSSITYKGDEAARSFLFDGLSAALDKVFR